MAYGALRLVAFLASLGFSSSLVLDVQPQRPHRHGRTEGHHHHHHQHHHKPQVLQAGQELKPKVTCKLAPKLLYIGVGHSGSTSLAIQLNKHPELKYGKRKEHRFFEPYPSPDGHCDQFTQYLDEFDVPCETKITFDATPGVFSGGNPYLGNFGTTDWHGHDFGVPFVDDVKSKLGTDAKFIFMMRNPVMYINSNLHSKSAKYVGDTFSQWLGDDNSSLPNSQRLLFTRSCYADSLEAWLKVFPKDKFLFIKAEDYFEDAQSTLDRIFKFLKVGPMKYESDDLQASGRRRASAKTVTREVSDQYFNHPVNQDCLHRLEKLTGLAFDWQSQPL